MIKTATAAVIASAILVASPSFAQNSYVIGISGAITGPAAGGYAPVVEGLRLYVEKLNKAGGVNGKQIELIITDDQGQASRGAANAQKLLTQDNVVMLVNASLSSTYAPMITGAQRMGVPLLFAGSVCPKEVYPPAQKQLFCTTAFAANYDSIATLDYVKEKAGTNVKLGLVAMAIPISRGEIDFAEKTATALGMQVVEKQAVPPPTADYTPVGSLVSQKDPNWVYSWAPWVTQVKTLESLRKLGWNKDYIAWGHIEAENELERLKDNKLYVVGANALFNEGLPVQKEIEAAAKAANSSYPANQMAEGWIGGMAIEAALKAAGWPAKPEAIDAAMQKLKVDTKGLRGGPIEWTAENHFRTKQYYRVYTWDAAKNAPGLVKDWKTYDVKEIQ